MITRETLKRLEFDKILAEVATRVHSDVTRQRLLETMPQGELEAIRLVSGRVVEIRTLAGLGIGLFLANATIERFGGKVRIFNREGGGACTQVALPILAPAVET